MSRVLLIAASNQTILNAVAIKEQYYNSQNVDLLIIVQLNSVGFDYSLYDYIVKRQIFQNVYVIEKSDIELYLNSIATSKIKRLLYSIYLERFLRIKLEFMSNVRYEQFICPMFYHYIPDIINAIKNIQHIQKLSISFYEEGTASYVYTVKGLALFNVYLIKFSFKKFSVSKRLKATIKYYFNEVFLYYKLKKYIDNRIYVYWPEHLVSDAFIPMKLKNLYSYSCLKELYINYVGVLDYVKINRYKNCKIIFMACYLLGTETIQVEIINKIIEQCNNYDFILKTHPGSTKNRKTFAAGLSNKIYVDRDAYYFDSLNLEVDFNNKIIVTVDSSVIMNFKNIFNVEPYVIFLYKLINNYYTDISYREECDRYVSDLKKTFDDSTKIVVPNSKYEFDYYLSLFKSRINCKS